LVGDYSYYISISRGCIDRGRGGAMQTYLSSILRSKPRLTEDPGSFVGSRLGPRRCFVLLSCSKALCFLLRLCQTYCFGAMTSFLYGHCVALLLLLSHLMGGVDAAPCRMCHGNFPSCKFAEDGTPCPTTGLVEANRAVMAAGTGTIRMVGLVNPSTHPNSTKIAHV
jgi:hypothetical protein